MYESAGIVWSWWGSGVCTIALLASRATRGYVGLCRPVPGSCITPPSIKWGGAALYSCMYVCTHCGDWGARAERSVIDACV